MKLTQEEKKLIEDRRAAAQISTEALKLAKREISEFLRDLPNDTTLSLAKQLRTEYTRLAGSAPNCTCDSQWTDTRCPARLAGWTSKRGGPCNQRPAPVMHIKIDLRNSD